MNCPTCSYAEGNGWWGPGHAGTHCQGCHRSWTSKAQSHCSECCRHFGSDSAGDAHRRGDRCVDPAGVERFDTADGLIWGGRDPEAMADLRARRGSRDRAQTAARVGGGQ